MTTPKPSALTPTIEQSHSADNPLAALTAQVLHDLQHQHLWTSLRVHTTATDLTQTPQSLPPENGEDEKTNLPTPIISGIPPQRIYTHPDEQLYMLDLGLRDADLPPERVYVFPATQGQKWSLRRLAAVFDALPAPVVVNEPEGMMMMMMNSEDSDKARRLAKYFERRRQAMQKGEWGGKRILMAMVDRQFGGDGTIVYYVVQEGIVKPRQN